MTDKESITATPWAVRDEEGQILSRHASATDAVDAMFEYPPERKLEVVMRVSAAEWDWLQGLLAEDEEPENG